MILGWSLARCLAHGKCSINFSSSSSSSSNSNVISFALFMDHLMLEQLCKKVTYLKEFEKTTLFNTFVFY